MPQLKEIDYNPFDNDANDERLKPVDGNPFSTETSQRAQDYAQTGSDVAETLSNYPGSYGRLMSGAAGAIGSAAKALWSDPIGSTVKTLDSAMEGMARNVFAPGLGAAQKLTGIGSSGIPAYEDAKDRFLNSRYGSPEALKQYIKADPAMAQADASLLLAGSGKLAGLVGAEKAGSALTRAAGIAEPMTAPIKMAGTAIGAVTPSRMLQKFYASSAKMLTTMDPVERNALAQKLMDADVRLSIKGFQRLQDQFNSLWKGVDQKIDQYVSAGPNRKIIVDELLKGVDALADEAALTGNKNDILRVKNRLKNDLTKDSGFRDANGNPIRVPRLLDAKEVNRAKRNFYKELNSLYGKASKPMASQAKMLVANNARKLIEEMVPDVIENNATASAYKELMDAIERGVNRIENRDLMSIGVPIKAGAGAVLGEGAGIEQLGGMLGIAAAVMDLPSVKSRTALLLNRLKKDGVKISPTATIFKLGMAEYQDKSKTNVMTPQERMDYFRNKVQELDERNK